MNPPPASPRKPLVVKSVSTRDIVLGVLGGLAVLGFVLYGILHMAQGVNDAGGMLEGAITARHFTPAPEEQITVGQGGLRQKEIAGVYTLEVRTREGKTYTVYVEKEVYDSHQIGDRLSFQPPPPRAP